MALIVVPVFTLTSGCGDVKGTVILNTENSKICTHAPKTFVLQVQTDKTYINSEGVTVNEVRTVCTDSGLASMYKVGSNYP